MPSFDIVSEINTMEVENAINQSRKEIATRFDLKDSRYELVQTKEEVVIKAEDGFKLKILLEIIKTRLSKRSIDPKSYKISEPDISPLGHCTQKLELKNGIDPASAKQIGQFVRSKFPKVTSQIQGDCVRVTSKSRDELQAVISSLRAGDFPCALTFKNFRD